MTAAVMSSRQRVCFFASARIFSAASGAVRSVALKNSHSHSGSSMSSVTPSLRMMMRSPSSHAKVVRSASTSSRIPSERSWSGS